MHTATCHLGESLRIPGHQEHAVGRAREMLQVEEMSAARGELGVPVAKRKLRTCTSIENVGSKMPREQ